jgi:hypothetical protein
MQYPAHSRTYLIPVLLFLAIFFLNCPSDGLVQGEEEDLGPIQKLRLVWRENPATTMTIGWVQNDGDAMVYYGTEDKGEDHAAYPYQASVDHETNWKGMDHHFVRLSGLQPDTAYYFVIRNEEHSTPRLWFKTAPADRKSFTFISGGDSRNNRDVRQAANRMVAKLRPLFVAFGGDYTAYSLSTEWKAWLNDWQLTIAEDGRVFPIVATRGNHETSNKDVARIFDTPSEDVYYALTFGDNFFRLYTLNSEISVEGSQSDWLTGDLENHSDTVWKAAQYHRPIRPHVASKSEEEIQRAKWANAFYEYEVNMVIESDAHCVKTTWPIKPSYGSGHDEGFVRDDNRGTVYLGEGTWGAPIREADDNKSWTRASGMFNQFKWARVSEDQITIRTVKYENGQDITPLDDSDPFAIPEGLDVWQAANGSEVNILPMVDLLPPDTRTETFPILTDNDDVEEKGNGDMYLDSSDLELIRDDLRFTDQTVGLRFNYVTVPAGATIEEAYIQFTVNETGDRSTTLNIRGNDVGNSPPFSSSDNNVTSRALTAFQVYWFPPGWDYKGAASLDQRTPDLSDVVQEIVDRGDWNSGNAMSFIISGSGRRVAHAREGSQGDAPHLTISWTE